MTKKKIENLENQANGEKNWSQFDDFMAVKSKNIVKYSKKRQKDEALLFLICFEKQ